MVAARSITLDVTTNPHLVRAIVRRTVERLTADGHLPPRSMQRCMPPATNWAAIRIRGVIALQGITITVDPTAPAFAGGLVSAEPSLMITGQGTILPLVSPYMRLRDAQRDDTPDGA